MSHSLEQELLTLRLELKSSSGKELEKRIRRRTEIQLVHPEYDPMLESWRRIAEKYRHLFKGRILDAGCNNGYLFHYLGKPQGYVGIDISEEAITVAREFFPEAEFRLQNLMEVEEHFDTIWCSQLVFPKMKLTADLAFDKLKSICDTLIFVVATEHAQKFSQPTEKFGRMRVAIWNK